MMITNLQDGVDSFNVTISEVAKISSVVLFAVGAGGLPERYTTLLNALAETGCMVVAPHFERLPSPNPREEDLVLRTKRLSLALDTLVPPCTKVIGVGHSIGAATLIALAGAIMWLGPNRRVNKIVPDSRLSGMVLLAPPTDFFQAPGALDEVRIPILAWVGSADNITPPHQTERLAQTMSGKQTVNVRITDSAGHFSFMDNIPPHITETLPNKQAFLHEYSSEVCKFVTG